MKTGPDRHGCSFPADFFVVGGCFLLFSFGGGGCRTLGGEQNWGSQSLVGCHLGLWSWSLPTPFFPWSFSDSPRCEQAASCFCHNVYLGLMPTFSPWWTVPHQIGQMNLIRYCHKNKIRNRKKICLSTFILLKHICQIQATLTLYFINFIYFINTIYIYIWVLSQCGNLGLKCLPSFRIQTLTPLSLFLSQSLLLDSGVGSIFSTVAWLQ